MTAAAEHLIAAFTDNPMNTPEVTCTLPVLSRVFEHPE